jgi:DNA-binding CsgD family transcriptional regulator
MTWQANEIQSLATATSVGGAPNEVPSIHAVRIAEALGDAGWASWEACERLALAPGLHLGRRERQVIALLLQGADTADLAHELCISRRTVKAHLNRLFMKFRIEGRHKRVKLAILLYPKQDSQPAALWPAPKLNCRERQIVGQVARGLSNHEIARSMGTTDHVIKNYLRRIYDKLGMWNRLELSLWYAARASSAEIRLA